MNKKVKVTIVKRDKRALMPKDNERLSVLQMKHPGDLTPDETVEMAKLEDRRAKHG